MTVLTCNLTEFKNAVAALEVTSEVSFSMDCYSYNGNMTVNTEGFSERVYFDKETFDEGDGWSRVAITVSSAD